MITTILIIAVYFFFGFVYLLKDTISEKISHGKSIAPAELKSF